MSHDDDALVQAVMVGGPMDGEVLQVRLDGPRVIALPKEGGGYVLEAADQLPRVFVWRRIVDDAQERRGCACALVVAAVLVLGVHVAVGWVWGPLAAIGLFVALTAGGAALLSYLGTHPHVEDGE